jgi:hypothetical protein
MLLFFVLLISSLLVVLVALERCDRAKATEASVNLKEIFLTRRIHTRKELEKRILILKGFDE